MKNIFIFILYCFMLINLPLRAQNTIAMPRYIDDILNTRGEVYFKFSVTSRQQLDNISPFISVDAYSNNEVHAYANRSEFEKFLAFNLPYTILPAPSTLINPVMKEHINIKAVNAWDYYPTYDAYENMMLQFQSTYPALCQVYNLGTLASGRKILVAKISDNVGAKENEPRFCYSSSMHGDELTGYVLMLRLMDYLLSNYTTDQQVANLVNNIEIWINPLANPDGTYAGGNNTVANATRYNANSVDLNRNFKNPKSGDHPDGNAWQTETLITMAFADSMRFTMSANFHGGEECINYPWDSWTSSQKIHADDSWLQLVSHLYADTVRYYSPSTYFHPTGSSFVNGITNGGDWYIALGSRQDYFTYFAYGREVTAEISNTKTPTASTLPNYWNYNYRSLLLYMQQCLFGLRGIVTDSCTGTPVEAQVFITGHDIDNSYVFSKLPIGNYHRLLLAGTYAVTFSAPGYAPKTYSNILISNFNTTVLNVSLAPIAPQAIISASPLNSCSGTVDFTANIQNADSWQWHFGDGGTDTAQNTSHLYNLSGTYHPYMSLTNCTGTQNMYLTDSIVIEKPAPPAVQPAYHCGPGSVILTSLTPGTIYWYNSISSTIPLDSGSNFTTPVLSQTTTYYADLKTDLVEHVGEVNSATGGAFFNSNVSHYLIFDCYMPVKLISVEVRADTARNRTIYLRNSASQVLDSAVVYIPSGESRINLDFDIPAGTNLQLAGPVYPNLYRSSTGLTYPYEITDYISVKSSSASTNPTSYYYYFYDWEVKLDECISERIPVQAEILSVPVAGFNPLVNDLEVQFMNASAAGQTYLWDFGDGTTSALENPLHQYAAYNTYNVTLIVTNSCGADTFSLQLELNTLAPAADFSASATNVAEGTTVQFTDLSDNNPNTWQWTFEGGTPATSNVQNPQVQYNVAGTYYVTLTATNAFGNDTETKSGYITVHQGALAPVADFTADLTVIDAGDSIHFTDLSLYTPNTWLWNIEGGTPSSSPLQNPVIRFNTPGTYYVSLIASNAYGSDYEIKYNYIQVNPATVGELFKVKGALTLFPNPVSENILNVLIPFLNEPFTVEVEDVLGRKMISVNCDNALSQNRLLTLNVELLPSGVYYLRLVYENRVYSGKFIR